MTFDKCVNETIYNQKAKKTSFHLMNFTLRMFCTIIGDSKNRLYILYVPKKLTKKLRFVLGFRK